MILVIIVERLDTGNININIFDYLNINERIWNKIRNIIWLNLFKILGQMNVENLLNLGIII